MLRVLIRRGRIPGIVLAIALVTLHRAGTVSPVSAASITVPSYWNITANGYDGVLYLDTLDGAGNLFGTVSFDPNRVEGIYGFWDEEEQKVTFYRGRSPDDQSARQVYSGYRFDWNGLTYFAGSFESMFASGGTASRSVTGWRAFQTQPGNVFCRCQYTGNGSSSVPLNQDIGVIANGADLHLLFTSIDSSGRLQGTLSSGSSAVAVFGLWDAAAQRLLFVRPPANGNADGMQVYTGYLMTSHLAGVTGELRQFSGTFEAFGSAGGSAHRSVFGWFSTFL